MTFTTRCAALIALSWALASHAAGPPAPAWGDAFKGLYNQSAAAVPVDAPVTVQEPLAIIFSDNIELWFQWVKDTTAYC